MRTPWHVDLESSHRLHVAIQFSEMNTIPGEDAVIPEFNIFPVKELIKRHLSGSSSMIDVWYWRVLHSHVSAL